MEQEQEISITFRPQVLEFVCNVLGQRPYTEVAPVLADIQRQLQQRAHGAPSKGNGLDAGPVQ